VAEKPELAEAPAQPRTLREDLRTLAKAIKIKATLERKKKETVALKAPGHNPRRVTKRLKDTPQAWLSTSRTESASHFS
jgi:hypothetical protein